MKRLFSLAVAGVTLAICATAHGQNRGPRSAPLRTIQLPYYILHTDLSDAEVRETDLRTTRMFEEYQRITAGFAQKVDRKFDFFLFRNRADYVAAGGPEKSAGVYIRIGDNRRLMAFTEGAADDGTWETVQHEGFHQFVDATVKAPLPPWITFLNFFSA